MAYINKEETKVIRDNLKKAFPTLKISVVNDNYSSLNISIMAGDIKFPTVDELYDVNDPYNKLHWDAIVNENKERQYMQVNHYHPQFYPKRWQPIIKKISKIANEGNYNNSDSQSDYFDVGWYVSLSIGKWDRPYVYTGV